MQDDRASLGKRFRPRLPAPMTDEAEGIGDVIKRITSAVGITPCGGCQQRAQALNERFPFRRSA